MGYSLDKIESDVSPVWYCVEYGLPLMDIVKVFPVVIASGLTSSTNPAALLPLA